MALIRICALLSLGALAIYHALRILAAQCAGAQCDNYTVAVLLLPLTLALAAVAGLLAIAAARRRAQGAWLALLSVCTLLGVIGPLVSLLVFRDSPDTFIAVTTALLALAPLVVLIYSFIGAPPVAPQAGS